MSGLADHFYKKIDSGASRGPSARFEELIGNRESSVSAKNQASGFILVLLPVYVLVLWALGYVLP